MISPQRTGRSLSEGLVLPVPAELEGADTQARAASMGPSLKLT